mmetsp:Transcript_32748/g.48494  ORF Transcript_32748/g.48494 Transcript_32748/m.48494 type:complete len:677 (+) Transcript_32748:186-2216(+)
MKILSLHHVFTLMLPLVEVQGLELHYSKSALILDPSTSPSVYPSRSMQPSASPSSSAQPSRSQMPSSLPSLSLQPSESLSPSSQPPSSSSIPTRFPSSSFSPSYSLRPSGSPTQSPYPTLSPAPTPVRPSASPSISILPTISIEPSITPPSYSPSVSFIPSSLPSVIPSSYPSFLPSNTPTISVLPTTSVLPSFVPSVIPSQYPTESPRPSPSPSAQPSFPPTTTLMPSESPTESFEPTTSSSPSSEPSSLPTTFPSSLPTNSPSSNQPSASPSLVPTTTSSKSPTIEPTYAPSAVPSVTMKDTSASLIVMQIYGIPFMNESQKVMWQDFTSQHIRNYWEKTSKAGVIVEDVETIMLEQSNTTRKLREQHKKTIQALNTASENYWAIQTKRENVKSVIEYNQTINFGYTDENSRVKRDESILFTEPFLFDKSTYTLMLEDVFNGDDEIIVANVTVITLVTSPPTSGPNERPTPPPNDNSQSGMNGTVLAVLVTVVLLIMAAVVFGFFYNNRRINKKREEADQWAAGEHRLIPTQQNSKFGEGLADENVPRQIGATITTPNFPLDDVHYNMPASTFMSPDKDNSTSATSTDPYNESDGGGSSLADSPYSYPVDNLLGGTNEEDYEFEDIEELDLLPSVDDNVLTHAPSFCGSSSIDDAPSLSGFNVTVMDIDEDFIK